MPSPSTPSRDIQRISTSSSSRTKKTQKKMFKVLQAYGFHGLDLSEKDFSTKGKIIQLGYEPLSIDIVTAISGREFKDVWRNKAEGTYGAQ
jgi:hypothetical protein